MTRFVPKIRDMGRNVTWCLTSQSWRSIASHTQCAESAPNLNCICTSSA